MIQVAKEQKGEALVVKLTGTIEESVNFDQLFGPVPQEVHVYTKGVTRINSVGVKAWIKYFQSLSAKSTKIKFFECSFAIIEQINLISNFAAGGTVESLYVPYLCQDCGAEYMSLYQSADLKKLEFNLPNMACAKCKSKNVSFDDIAEEYFYFLMQ